MTRAAVEVGVTLLDPSRVQPGYNLYLSGHAPTATLMDLHGRVVHRWGASFDELFPELRGASQPALHWRHVQVFPGGDLIGVWEPYGIFKLDRDSNILWSRANLAHYEFVVTDDGRIVHLGFRRIPVEGRPGKTWIDDLIITLDADGRDLGRLSMAHALEAADWRQLRDDFWEREAERDSHLRPAALFDPFHTNAIWLLSAEEANLLGRPFAEGQALVSMCLLDTIAAIDLRAETTHWWQTGPFALQHQPRPTADGLIVLFNNHVSRRESSVQMIDPADGAVVWEYFGPAEEPLFSETSGSVEPLPNGNLLIIETNRGRVLEITRDQENVWEFRNPHRTGPNDELTANIFQLERVPESVSEFAGL